MTKVELLSPAGSLDKLKTVYRYGADAAYLGGKSFNLRAGAKNFSDEELKEAVELAKNNGKKLYITLNILAHNRDIKPVEEYLQYLETLGVDAVIVSDLGILSVVKENSNIPVHISTQASVSNWRSVKMYHDLGAERVILARELSLDEIREIKDKVPEMELEVFAHGAMCMSYSGRCSISHYLTNRSGNYGLCANPCRWKFSLQEEKRPGQYYPVVEDESGSYIYNSKDLCAIDFLDQVVKAGVSSVKIEGRGKGVLYGATTAKVYREALDQCENETFQPDPERMEELKSFTHRDYTTGFFFGSLDEKAIDLAGKTYHPFQLAAVVKGKDEERNYLLATRNQIREGMELHIIKPKGKTIKVVCDEMWRADNGEKLEVVHPNNNIKVKWDLELEEGDLIRARYKA